MEILSPLLMTADQSSAYEGAVDAARFLAKVLAERAFHALCWLEGSPLPEGRCIDCKQTSLFGANPQRTRSSAAALS